MSLCLTRRSLFSGNSRRHLLQNPVGTLVGTVVIAAKSEDRSLLDNLGRVTRRVLISPGIRCAASDCTIKPYVCQEVLLLLGCVRNTRTCRQQHFGKEGVPETLIANISQETLAKMIGTTRSRVSSFMNRFRKLGFIDYHGGNDLQVHGSLLNIVLHD